MVRAVTEEAAALPLERQVRSSSAPGGDECVELMSGGVRRAGREPQQQCS